ncbi:exodeoxyribonuclease VII large subunit [Arenimonas sp.]|uniref:exodeoxyribonuclease VII large subunit n=1 Tax=Arenimonas sp. TaxID=1872635 RepID=UPI0039E51333
MNTLARERAVLKPAQLNALARDLLEGSFAQVWVEGEISNYSRPASGHVYFTLKDERAQVRCALFKQKAMHLRFAPRDGLQVLVRGRLTLYEARGDYQLVLEHMEEAGEGALRRAFEELKAKLAAEGLFATERKRALPRHPHRLGVITSPSGAAVRDVISVLRRRFPLLPVDVLPVPVQGDAAAAAIRAMLAKANASALYDVLLIARGGGSLEDLWCFNDEALARAIAASATPVVSAVGHETDFTLADFAADLRAPTPSAAAELLVNDATELSARLRQARKSLVSSWRRTQQARAQRADQAFLRLQAMQPGLRLERARLRLQALSARLQARMARELTRRESRLRELALALQRHQPQRRLDERRHRADLLMQKLRDRTQLRLQGFELRLRGLGRALASVSPLATLGRGYAIVRDASGKVVRSSEDVAVGEELEAMLEHGRLRLRVEKKAPPQE